MEFTPLRGERCALLIPHGAAKTLEIRALLDASRSTSYRRDLEALKSYDVTKTGEQIARIQHLIGAKTLDSPDFAGSRYNEHTGLAVVCPIMSHAKGYRFELPIDVDGISGVIIVDQARNLDWRARSARFIAAAPESVLLDVVQIAAGLIGAAA